MPPRYRREKTAHTRMRSDPASIVPEAAIHGRRAIDEKRVPRAVHENAWRASNAPGAISSVDDGARLPSAWHRSSHGTIAPKSPTHRERKAAMNFPATTCPIDTGSRVRDSYVPAALSPANIGMVTIDAITGSGSATDSVQIASSVQKPPSAMWMIAEKSAAEDVKKHAKSAYLDGEKAEAANSRWNVILTVWAMRL